jgi:hypothetical protein
MHQSATTVRPRPIRPGEFKAPTLFDGLDADEPAPVRREARMNVQETRPTLIWSVICYDCGHMDETDVPESACSHCGSGLVESTCL